MLPYILESNETSGILPVELLIKKHTFFPHSYHNYQTIRDVDFFFFKDWWVIKSIKYGITCVTILLRGLAIWVNLLSMFTRIFFYCRHHLKFSLPLSINFYSEIYLICSMICHLSNILKRLGSWIRLDICRIRLFLELCHTKEQFTFCYHYMMNKWRYLLKRRKVPYFHMNWEPKERCTMDQLNCYGNDKNQANKKNKINEIISVKQIIESSL